MNSKTLTITLVSGLLLTGCTAIHRTTGLGAPTVDESWVARVPQDQRGDIDAAREDVILARQERAQLKASHEDATSRVDVSRSRLDAAENRVDAEETRLDAALIRNDPGEIKQARAALEEARMEHEVAKAQHDLRRAQEDHATQAVHLAEQQVQLHEARLEHAKYEALRGYGDPRAGELSGKRFLEAVRAEEDDVLRARSDVQEAQTLVAQHQRNYERAQDRLEASRSRGTPQG